MRPILLASAVAVLVLAFTPLARPQDRAREDEDAKADRELETLSTRLPQNPFAESKKGDWWAYALKALEVEGEKVKVERGVVVWRVTDVDGDDVLVSEELKLAGTKKWDWLGKNRAFDRQEAPTLLAIFPRFLATGGGAGKFSSVRTTDEKLTFAGVLHDAKKISFVATIKEPRLPFFVTLWLLRSRPTQIASLTVKLGGLDDIKFRYELAGYGTKDGAEWGKTPEQLEPEKK